MGKQELRAALEDYPYALRQRVLDYATRVEESANDIFKDAGIDHPREEEIANLIFIAGVRKLWSLLEFQYRTLQAVLTADDFGVSGLRVGGAVYTATSRDFLALRDLHNHLRGVLERGELLHLVQRSALTEIAQEVAR